MAETDPEDRTEAAPPGGRAAMTSAVDDGPPLLAGRYEILGMLGSGAMGTVYRARDRELDETVALKILRKELAASPGMLERFRREVKLARRVTHKNVARTFDIGEDGGDRFLTMELIEGEMLGAHLARRGRVPLREVVTIGRDVCAGLAAAHAADVLHRDLKPENVIIAHDRRAVITDFGIARAVTQGELGRTGGGMVGTPAYMAPEQVEGAADLDGRTDLYALGTMLFELLSGTVAWPGDSVFAVAAGRILRPPPDVRSVAPDVPEGAALVVLKLMARRPADRFATAEEAGEAIAALAPSASPSARSLLAESSSAPERARTARKMVAVLPIVNLGAEDDAYLAQTVTEDLVDLLSVVPELRVRPRGETARFDQRSRDVREAGRALNVDVVVDGSVRRIGDDIRVSVRLVTVEDGFQLWARRFDRPAAQFLTIADEAAAAIARALATELTAAARPVVGDAVAQELYLRGRHLLHRGWFEVSAEGVGMLREAYARAPDDLRIAGAYALASARTISADPKQALRAVDARELAEKILAADPSQAEARIALGFLHLHNSEGVAAAEQLKRALVLHPNAVEALDAVGRVLIEVGRGTLGLVMLGRAVAIDPLMAHSRHAAARAHALLGDYEAALEMLGPTPEHPGEFTPHMLLRTRIAMWRGDREESARLQVVVDRPDLSAYARQSLLTSTFVGATGTLTPELSAALSSNLPDDKRYPPRRLSFHAQLRAENKIAGGDVDGGLGDLRVADRNGLLDLMWLDRCPLFDPLRTRPEFVAVRASTAVRAERVVDVLDPS